MKPKEVKAFEVKYGYKPTAVRVAIDALAVFVHKDNPIQGLSIQQVDAAFSANRKCGGAKTITAWGDLGVLDGQSVALFGRNSKSGTHAYFQKKALCKGDFASSVKELASSDKVVDIIAKTPNGMGYSGIGYNKPGVRALPLSKKAAGALLWSRALKTPLGGCRTWAIVASKVGERGHCFDRLRRIAVAI